MNQVVQIPLTDWKRITRQLDRLEGELKKHKAEWITTSEFIRRTGKTKRQVEYMRMNNHPDFFKPKGTTGRYLVDFAKYQKTYNP